MSTKKLTRADLKRIEDLNKKVNAQKVENAKEKVRLNKVRKEIEAAKKKVAGERKELKNSRKQAQLSSDFHLNVAQKEAVKSSKVSTNGPQVKRLQEELLQMKTKFNHEGKRARSVSDCTLCFPMHFVIGRMLSICNVSCDEPHSLQPVQTGGGSAARREQCAAEKVKEPPGYIALSPSLLCTNCILPQSHSATHDYPCFDLVVLCVDSPPFKGRGPAH